MDHSNFNPLEVHWEQRIYESRKLKDPTAHLGSLVHERSLALGNVVDKSTLSSYGSALNSYLNFIRMHDFPVKPTAETLSFFTVYMCHYINPRSVNTYLSRISV